MQMNRRNLLKAGGALGALMLTGAGRALAAAPKLTVNTYGGLYAKAVNENFVAHYIKQTGGEAVAVVDIPSAALSKIRATMPKPDYDLYIATANDTLRAIELGLVEEIAPADLPDLVNVPEPSYAQWGNKAVSFSYGTGGFLYDTRKIPNPPRTWVEFAERTAKGEFGRAVAIPSANQAGVLEACVFPIVHAFGGTMANPDIGFKKLAAMTPYVAKFYSDMSEVVQLMATGEIAIAIYVDGRSWAFVDQNPWANFIVPEKGGTFQSSQIMKVKNSPADAWKLMNAFINADAAKGFVAMIKYPVTNTKVVYPESMKNRVTNPKDILYPPFAEIAKNTPALIERWNKEVGG
ncbi:ABC transporter substrate-binding protein [Chelatococcus asaccharovorans]|uniref:ABC transporter substrate-binding protein n=1 Tax=Chelatococcus asaccharovorans TaxID=28210 RepID=UPI00224C6AE3|nr:substrate-binding domain-containing protein [Chelatococcus asaccharovorans]CAH1667514.1 putative spermidine/putrescine transport system substrate-binding protein [Chelatococcus asaccharovorans]CAH1680883.1 putative spermidine/putrescine transport system substrate-binding protein [Chelatococcus asaccharovorans]